MLRLEGSVRAAAPALMAGVRADAQADEIVEAMRRALENVPESSLLV
jgi:hypothetical protein